MSLESLEGQVTVITGGNDGLGKALAEKLIKEGAKLAIIGRDEKKNAVAKNELGDVEVYKCDVSDKEQITETFNAIKEKFGTIDILINDAGIWYEGKTEDHPADKIKELFAVNSIGPIFAAQEVLPLMKEKKEGQIFNVSSIAGVQAEPGWPVYVGTKYALRGFTEALEAELDGTGIRVMGFYPGGMDTKLFTSAGFPAENEPWMMDKNNVAEVIIFMLKQPKDMVIDKLVVKSMRDSELFNE